LPSVHDPSVLHQRASGEAGGGNTALDLVLRALPMPRDERCGKAV
jgi:hypothetical protein